jgi:hypothetical protein
MAQQEAEDEEFFETLKDISVLDLLDRLDGDARVRLIEMLEEARLFCKLDA